MALYRFTPHTTAKGQEVTGTSSPYGNDYLLRTLMASVQLRQKTHRWSTFTQVESLYRVTAGTNVGELGGAADNAPDESTLGEVMGTQRIMGKAESGMWLISASVQIRSAISQSKDSDNYVTVSMFKDTARKVETGLTSGDWDDVVSIGAPIRDTAKESARSAYLVPETQIRSIANVDDSAGTNPAGLIHVVLPIEVQYIAGGEYWAFEARPNGDAPTTGWYSATVFLQFAELHKT